MNNLEHHIFIAHRDDAILTFGGYILKTLVSGEQITVHLVYGQDGYIRHEFLDDLRDGDTKITKYLKDLASQSHKEEVFDHILQLSNSTNPKDVLQLGVEIRTIEEQACMNHLGVLLKENQLPCGFPLRGYSTFNGNNLDDINSQIEIVKTEVVNPSIEKVHTKRSKITCYFPSGIGGHVDHRILTQCGKDLDNNEEVKVFFGQDLPYASILEWFQYSDLPLVSANKTIINISQFLRNKLDLLERYYKSQLTLEDIRVIEVYHHSLAELLHREYFAEFFKKNEWKEDELTAIEYLYSIANKS